MGAKENPFFAKALVNRYWKHFFSRGLVEPEDDMRETNPASNPELLDALAAHFIKSGFDLKSWARSFAPRSTPRNSGKTNLMSAMGNNLPNVHLSTSPHQEHK
jgi:hypothetical protein